MQFDSKNTPRGLIFIAGFILSIVAGIIIFAHDGDKEPQWLMLAAGIAYGFVLFLLASRWGWLWVVGIFALAVVTLDLEIYALGWFGGFIAGTNFGAALKSWLWEKNRPRTEWIVNRQGFDTAAQVKEAALKELQSLDGRKKGHLLIVHRGSTLQMRGSVEHGVVVHKTVNNKDERGWGVLTKEDESTSELKEIPMGGFTGAMPLAFIHDVYEVQAVLYDFISNPQEPPRDRIWTTGPLSDDTLIPISW